MQIGRQHDLLYEVFSPDQVGADLNKIGRIGASGDVV